MTESASSSLRYSRSIHSSRSTLARGGVCQYIYVAGCSVFTEDGNIPGRPGILISAQRWAKKGALSGACGWAGGMEPEAEEMSCTGPAVTIIKKTCGLFWRVLSCMYEVCSLVEVECGVSQTPPKFGFALDIFPLDNNNDTSINTGLHPLSCTITAATRTFHTQRKD